MKLATPIDHTPEEVSPLGNRPWGEGRGHRSVSDGTGYWDRLTPIWSDGEHVGGSPERADGCPAAIAAERNILHLEREDIGSLSPRLDRCVLPVASGYCHLRLRLFLLSAAHVGAARRSQRRARGGEGCERG